MKMTEAEAIEVLLGPQGACIDAFETFFVDVKRAYPGRENVLREPMFAGFVAGWTTRAKTESARGESAWRVNQKKMARAPRRRR